MRKNLVFLLLIYICTMARGQSSYCYWFDDDTSLLHKETANACMHIDVDVKALTNGLHRLFFVLTDKEGAIISQESALFIKTDVGESVAHYFYWIDNDQTVTQVGVANEFAHFDIDMTALENGLHTLHYALADNTGKIIDQQSALFVKRAINRGIVYYEYYVNDIGEAVKSVRLDEPYNSYQLLEALDVPSIPIRSQCFHFEIGEGDQPIVMAKNDISFHFFDEESRFTEGTAQYIDPNVSEPVVAQLLVSKKTINSNSPKKDHINWYKVQAQQGDSLIFKKSATATMQLFSPDGVELINSTKKELNMRVSANGTYYLAIHDVTDGSSLYELYYERIIDETAIQDAVRNQSMDEHKYNLNGMPVMSERKGIYIIGRKKKISR